MLSKSERMITVTESEAEITTESESSSENSSVSGKEDQIAVHDQEFSYDVTEVRREFNVFEGLLSAKRRYATSFSPVRLSYFASASTDSKGVAIKITTLKGAAQISSETLP